MKKSIIYTLLLTAGITMFNFTGVHASTNLTFDDAINHMIETTDTNEIDKLLNEGLSVEEAEYYSKLHTLNEFMETNEIYVDLADVEDAKPQELTRSVESSKDRVLNGDKSEIKKTLLNSSKVDDLTNNAKAFMEKEGRNSDGGKFTFKDDYGNEVIMETTKSDQSNGLEQNGWKDYTGTNKYYISSVGGSSNKATGSFTLKTGSYYTRVSQYVQFYVNNYVGGANITYSDSDAVFSGFVSSFTLNTKNAMPNGSSGTVSRPATVYSNANAVVSKNVTVGGSLELGGGVISGGGNISTTLTSNTGFTQYVYFDLYGGNPSDAYYKIRGALNTP